MLPGAHRIRSRRPDGSLVEYWYAWRGGGPQLLRATAANEKALDRKLAAALPEVLKRYDAIRRPGADKRFLHGLITHYLESAAFTACAQRTRYDRRRLLDRVRGEIGKMELRALDAKGARAALIRWRDTHETTPKTADDLLGALSTVLQWATDRGEIAANPVREFPRLYKANRADVIWLPEDLDALLPHCAPEMAQTVRLAALSGLRMGDLIKLPWGSVGENAIVWQTGKSRGRRTVVIPLYSELKALLADIPRGESVTVINSARKRPWTEAGLESAMRRAKLDTEAAGARSVRRLRFHDLRGTAATNFIRAGLDLYDVATILGWSKAKVEQIAARYVTSEQIGLAMIEKLARNKAETESVKRPVKS
jgi:site-specific recombinase XerD